MPFGIGFLDQTNNINSSRKPYTLTENGCKGKSDKALQLEMYKMHGANNDIYKGQCGQ
jgi:hypothetical protein